MRISEVRIGFSRTINLGNFQNAKVEASVVAEIDEGDVIDDLMPALQAELRQILEATWKAQHINKGTMG